MGEPGEEMNLDISKQVKFVTSNVLHTLMMLPFQQRHDVLNLIHEHIDAEDIPEMFEHASHEVK